jgi:1,4-dihydroxy-2-naphthoate octaprenyltransferase/chlorophyll synthase
MLKIWWTAIRPSSLVKIVLPMIVGLAWGFGETGVFRPAMIIAAVLFSWFDQIAIILLNDYADAEADTLHTRRFPTLIDSRAVPHGRLERRELLIGGGVSSAALLGLGVVLASCFDRPLGPWLALLALSLVWVYSFPPVRLNYRGMGEIIEVVGVGGVLPTAGFYIYSGTFAQSPVILLPLLFLAFSSAVSSGLKHLPADRETGKKTLSVLFGDRVARTLILLGLGLGIATLVGLVPLGYLGPSSLLVTVPLPALFGAVCLKHVGRATYDDLGALKKFKGAVHMTILFASLGLAFGLARG